MKRDFASKNRKYRHGHWAYNIRTRIAYRANGFRSQLENNDFQTVYNYEISNCKQCIPSENVTQQMSAILKNSDKFFVQTTNKLQYRP